MVPQPARQPAARQWNPAWQHPREQSGPHAVPNWPGAGGGTTGGATGGENNSQANLNFPLFSPDLYAEPFESSESDDSDGSHMSNRARRPTPPGSPTQADSPRHAASADLGRLSLEEPQTGSHLRNNSGDVVASTCTKRSGDTDIPSRPSKHAAATATYRPPSSGSGRNAKTFARPPTRVSSHARSQSWQTPVLQPRQHSPRVVSYPKMQQQLPSGNNEYRPSIAQSPGSKPRMPPIPQDSGYISGPSSRQNTLQLQQPLANGVTPQLAHQSTMKSKPNPGATCSPRQTPSQSANHQKQNSSAEPVTPNISSDADQQSKSNMYYPNQYNPYDMELEPPTSAISQGQLATEIKGIYAGLVLVEQKCVHIDAAQAKDPSKQLTTEQWQALIALHRTLLYEHHDFLMATHHPAANESLRGLAVKYQMPARMWKHGIHAFLEVLRMRRPASQDYMIGFIYLAYQMTALLVETVPAFSDTWIECLGDLARYRMAIEEDKELHTLWGGVASLWYNAGSDRHPAVGRLYHHLGILERPSMRKFFLYAKSLTCSMTFPSGRDSLTTLAAPIARGEQSLQTMESPAEAALLKYYSVAYLASEHELLKTLGPEATAHLHAEPTANLVHPGIFAVTTAISSLFEFGAPSNSLFHIIGTASAKSIQAKQSPGKFAASYTGCSPEKLVLPPTSCSATVFDNCYATFNWFANRPTDQQSLLDLLPSVHTILVFLHGIHSLRSQLQSPTDINTCSPLLASSVFSWGGLTAFLNRLVAIEPIDRSTIDLAFNRSIPFPAETGEKYLLPEDHYMRGLVWTSEYFPQYWFNYLSPDDERFHENERTRIIRVARVQWLAMYMAMDSDYMEYDFNTGLFSAPEPGPKFTPPPVEAIVQRALSAKESQMSVAGSRSPTTTTTLSVASDSDGYGHVNRGKPTSDKSWAKVAAGSVSPSTKGTELSIANMAMHNGKKPKPKQLRG